MMLKRLADMGRDEICAIMARLAVRTATTCEELGIDNPEFVLVVADRREAADQTDGPETIQLIANLSHEDAFAVLRQTLERIQLITNLSHEDAFAVLHRTLDMYDAGVERERARRN